MNRYQETLYPDWGQSFAIKEMLYRDRTEHQDLAIFETERFGRVLALDGVIQTTEGDEFMYHEMLVHVPILAHGDARKVLIVGGGDGGSLREALKHPRVEPVMVEIDGGVIEFSKKWLPTLSDGAFDDPRSRIVIADGCEFMKTSDETFDVIIIDSTDPVGPGAVLFTEEFYADCRRRLNPGGVMTTQNGVPRLQPREVTDSHRRLSASFEDVWFYVTAVPTYVGGFMTLGWGATDAALRLVPTATLRERFAANPFPTRYYTPDIHAAGFALPRYVLDLFST